ncbi:hypothetical protein B0H63DRAFT_520925 [Podospora didyma]|uniref:Uncharacterized protein n=1 Tax=Podospora didyma TaxID=330526 RepID=A0AAE0NSG9_9PEZI|nr:hypothetical protein B0H63DRAFT_520925 [Podospora didyma]
MDSPHHSSPYMPGFGLSETLIPSEYETYEDSSEEALLLSTQPSLSPDTSELAFWSSLPTSDSSLDTTNTPSDFLNDNFDVSQNLDEDLDCHIIDNLGLDNEMFTSFDDALWECVINYEELDHMMDALSAEKTTRHEELDHVSETLSIEKTTSQHTGNPEEEEDVIFLYSVRKTKLQYTDNTLSGDIRCSEECGILDDEEEVIFPYSRLTLPKRKIRKRGASKRRPRAKSAKWAKVFLRIEKVGFNFEGSDESTEYCWNRRQKSWVDRFGGVANIGGLFDDNIKTSYVEVRPAGDGFPVRISYDEKKGEAFTGFDDMNQKDLCVGKDLVKALISEADSRVFLGRNDS